MSKYLSERPTARRRGNFLFLHDSLYQMVFGYLHKVLSLELDVNLEHRLSLRVAVGDDERIRTARENRDAYIPQLSTVKSNTTWILLAFLRAQAVYY
jgi:hypothetical protein